MALLPETAARPRVMVVGKDAMVTRALTKLLALDDGIAVLGAAPSISTAPIGEVRPDLIIFDRDASGIDGAQAQTFVEHTAPAAKLCLLESLHDMTLGEMLRTLRTMAPPSTAVPAGGRHLQPVPESLERQALATLSERELEVVRLVAEGLSNKEISSRLSLSDKTVKNHISHILAKMNLSARTQVAVYAIRAGLV